MVVALVGPEPAVIDEELCRRCLGTTKPKLAASDSTQDAKKEALSFREAKMLLLSYHNILRIDNLAGFDNLVKLQLDNNIIEKIENLGHLRALEALDLSFNNISEITGLDNLTSLTNLSFFSNHISTISGMDTLHKLQVLSLGNNMIKNLDAIMYLRPKKELQAINLVGNPFCQETEYRAYVLSHLKYIKYLDYRLVDEQAVSAAREQYQDEILDLEEAEQAAVVSAQADEERAEKIRRRGDANIPGMDRLFEEVMVSGDGEMDRLRSMQTFDEMLVQLKEHVDQVVDEYVATILSHHELKLQEKQLFDEALGKAKAEASVESMAEIAKYSKLQKRSLAKVMDDATEHPHAVLQTLHKANEALYEKLMGLEITQAERYAETIKTFEGSYDELTKRTLEQTQALFGRLREMESEYHEKIINAGLEVLERVASSDVETFPEEARVLLGDKDTLMGAITVAHDTRVANLDAKEDELRQREEKALASLMDQVHEEEYMRNRIRVIEVWKLIHEVNKKELENYHFEEK
ncbi:hypothetical protein AB1Y20_011542 [Prymnesium parvum]|uniref:Dynein regulatory complex subunit 3 n=1 Tax=Prymnesium parvum TaxID=97485 RepID=A0AB34IGU4_PRYPA